MYKLIASLFRYVALPAIENKGLEIVLDIDPKLPSKIIGDPKRIRQIMLNLLNNAAKVLP